MLSVLTPASCSHDHRGEALTRTDGQRPSKAPVFFPPTQTHKHLHIHAEITTYPLALFASLSLSHTHSHTSIMWREMMVQRMRYHGNSSGTVSCKSWRDLGLGFSDTKTCSVFGDKLPCVYMLVFCVCVCVCHVALG